MSGIGVSGRLRGDDRSLTGRTRATGATSDDLIAIGGVSADHRILGTRTGRLGEHRLRSRPRLYGLATLTAHGATFGLVFRTPRKLPLIGHAAQATRRSRFWTPRVDNNLEPPSPTPPKPPITLTPSAQQHTPHPPPPDDTPTPDIPRSRPIYPSNPTPNTTLTQAHKAGPPRNAQRRLSPGTPRCPEPTGTGRPRKRGEGGRRVPSPATTVAEGGALRGGALGGEGLWSCAGSGP
ncbi:hypothetical protein GCM10022221_55640 [Actinocorallia aurea]